MAAANQMARVEREIGALAEAVEADLRHGSRMLGPAQKRRLRAEIEGCMQQLDELRNRLAE